MQLSFPILNLITALRRASVGAEGRAHPVMGQVHGAPCHKKASNGKWRRVNELGVRQAKHLASNVGVVPQGWPNSGAQAKGYHSVPAESSSLLGEESEGSLADPFAAAARLDAETASEPSPEETVRWELLAGPLPIGLLDGGWAANSAD